MERLRGLRKAEGRRQRAEGWKIRKVDGKAKGIEEGRGQEAEGRRVENPEG